MRNKDGQTVSITWPLIKRVFTYARPYRRQISAMLAVILFTTVVGLLRPLIFRDLIDVTLPEKDLGRLNVLAVGLFFIPLMGGALKIWQKRLSSSVAEGVTYDLRMSLYNHLQKMSLRFYTNTKTGELMSRLNNDVKDAQSAISNTIVDIVSNLVQLVATLTVMLALEWRLTALGILILPMLIPLAKRSSMIQRDLARQSMDDNAKMNALMHETLNIGGVLLVKLFGRRREEVNRFDQHAAMVRDIGVKRSVASVRFSVVMGLLGAIGTAAVYWIGGYMVLKGVFTIGTIVAFTAYLGQFYSTLQSLSNAPISFATSLVSFERVFEVIDLPLDIAEKPDALVLDNVQGRIEFDHVSFRYDAENEVGLSYVRRHGQVHQIEAVLSGGQDNNGVVKSETLEEAITVEPSVYSQARVQALDGVSFTIQPGQLVALVGPSGAGKTTTTYLVPRLYDPTAGRILLDGHNLRDVALDALAENVGMVTQETHLFHDTIRTNLLYARLDATQAEIEAACRAANIHDFIIGLPNGYETIVGERGYRLSGGEKQRLAIARVILKNPRILVLDEATSHLDSQSEALIQDALKTVMAGRTSIVIAHRLSTILAADLILVMDRGQVVEHGTHSELLANNGLYKQLYETQFSRELVGH
ncbi:MAG: ABC transporter ATP-binding protein [Chloroflexi bacterium]|nr:ABC transporter ATP-binding protein [Chloroflexota bacterium]